MLALKPSRLGPDLQSTQRGRIVYENGRFRQLAHRSAEMRPIFIGQAAYAQPMRVHPRLRTQQPLSQLMIRHLQAENPHRHFMLNSGVAGDAQSKSRIVDDEVVGHKVVRLWNRQIIDLFLADILDTRHPVPEEVTFGHLDDLLGTQGLPVHLQSFPANILIRLGASILRPG